MINVRDFYRKRFKLADNERNKIWNVLCSSFFQKHIKKTHTVLDIGAGYCEFINNIQCKKKIAVEINPDVQKYAGKSVLVIRSLAQNITEKLNNTVDIVMMSNFLEHLTSKEEALSVLKKVNKLLKTNGKIIILQPNIDLVKEAYWDFYDHNLPFNIKSINEGLAMSGFDVVLSIKRFLPYTTKSFLPKNIFLVKLYLKLPSFLRPFAGLSLIIAKKR